MRETDAEWLIFQTVSGAAILAVIGGGALLFNASLDNAAGLLAGIAGAGLIAIALFGFRSFLRGDWNRD